MKIIKNYWGNKQKEILSENMFLEHIKKHEISKVYIATKLIKNFKINIENGRMILRYSLSAGKNLKYYCSLLNHSICVKDGTAIFLEDINWLDYENQILNKQTLCLLDN